ncbi:ATP-binding protein [Roseateles sp. L2-2]|uniref:ATP-binding protein n=1 Tax=Roseateles sp. L2-2 TaxID=3422597 RepID=UPI003D36D994
MASRVLLSEGVPVPLSGRQLDLLGVLVAHRGAVVSKNELLNRVWPGQAVEENNAAVHVSALRRTLGREAIATVAGQGYRFALPLRQEEDASLDPTDRAVGASWSAMPASPIVRPRALPSAPVAMHGRGADLQALLSRLVRHRLVTVVGAPGVGKSTLALACAHERRQAARDGAVWVDLLGGDDPSDPLPAVAAALGLDPGTDLPTLLALLRPMSLLLVLDNAEIAGARAATFCHAVLENTEDVALMVTSRKVLRVPGERVLRTPPLSVPPPGAGVDESLMHGSVALFVDQVRAQGQPFALGAHNVAQVTGLCRRLDGIPLALQLAAGRLAMFGIDQLCERLSDRYRLLTRGTQAGPRRHQSLRACMDASLALLDDVEQLVLRRLEPFEGGFTLEMATAALSDRQLDAWTVAEALEGLVDHSLVQVDAEDRPRYRLFDGIRAYGLLLLEETGEVDIARGQHARAMSQLFDRAERALQMMPDARWIAEFSPELGNVRTALDWCLEHEPVRGLGLLAHSRALFELLSLVPETAWRHAAYEAELPAELPPAVLARYCIDHAGLLAPHDPKRAAIWYRRGVTVSRTADDPALRYLALCRQVVEDRELSQAAMRYAMGELVALAGRCEGAHAARLKLWGLAARAHVWRVEGQADEADEAMCASLQLAQEIGASRWVLDDLHRLMQLQVGHGAPLRSAALVRQWEDGASRASGINTANGEFLQRVLGCLAAVLLAEGHTEDARDVLTGIVAPRSSRAAFRDSRVDAGSDARTDGRTSTLVDVQSQSDTQSEAFDRLLPVFAWLAFEEGRDQDAARLTGYAGQAYSPIRSDPLPPWGSVVQRMRARLDGFSMARLQDEGNRWDEPRAMVAALARTAGVAASFGD